MSKASDWAAAKPPKFVISGDTSAFVSDDGRMVIVRESAFPVYISVTPETACMLSRWIHDTFGEFKKW